MKNRLQAFLYLGFYVFFIDKIFCFIREIKDQLVPPDAPGNKVLL